MSFHLSWSWQYKEIVISPTIFLFMRKQIPWLELYNLFSLLLLHFDGLYSYVLISFTYAKVILKKTISFHPLLELTVQGTYVNCHSTFLLMRNNIPKLEIYSFLFWWFAVDNFCIMVIELMTNEMQKGLLTVLKT